MRRGAGRTRRDSPLGVECGPFAFPNQASITRCYYSGMDIRNYHVTISRPGQEPVEVDLRNLGSRDLATLRAEAALHADNDTVAAITGILADGERWHGPTWDLPTICTLVDHAVDVHADIVADTGDLTVDIDAAAVAILAGEVDPWTEDGHVGLAALVMGVLMTDGPWWVDDYSGE